ncbi:hypothetical protein GQX74_006192 [Glossina fuscipes]|nr:hypothetical protein GQX74_006192 [Glossina fuscipes]
MQLFNNKFIIVLILIVFCKLSDSLFFPIVKDFKHKLFGPYGRESDYNQYNTQYGYPYGSSYRNSPTTQYYPNNSGTKRGGRTYSDIARVTGKISILMLFELSKDQSHGQTMES